MILPSCARIAPTPTRLASTRTCDCLAGLKYSSLMSNASCSHRTSFLVSLRRGSVRDAKSGIKRRLWNCVLANMIPRKDRILLIFFGASQLSIFFGSALIPSALNTWPKKVSSWTENLHFPLFSFAPLSSSLFSVAWRLLSCSAWVFPKTMMSSYKFRTPGRSASISDLVFWNISAAAFTQNKSACNVEYQRV